MSVTEIPDRRPLLYIVMGVVIAAIAVVLFWPHGKNAHKPDMVLTPESVRQASELATDVETAPPTTEASVAAEDAAVPGDAFPVHDAKLPSEDATTQKAVSSTPAKPTPTKPAPTQTATAKPTATRPVTQSDTSGIQPSSTGDYVIYVGSYSDRANAQRAAEALVDKGIHAQVMDAGTRYRVAVGYFTSSARAETYAKTLKSKLGLDYWVGQGG